MSLYVLRAPEYDRVDARSVEPLEDVEDWRVARGEGEVCQFSAYNCSQHTTAPPRWCSCVARGEPSVSAM